MSVYELIRNNTAFGIAESVVRWPSGLGGWRETDVAETDIPETNSSDGGPRDE